MKKEVKRILKERNKLELYTEDRYNITKAVMQLARTKDKWLGMYLSLDPLNKSQWIADHLMELTEKGKM